MLSHTRSFWLAPLAAAALACGHTTDEPTSGGTHPTSNDPRPTATDPAAPSTDARAPSLRHPGPVRDGDVPPPPPEEVDTLAQRFLREPLAPSAPFEGEIVLRVVLFRGMEATPPARYAFVFKGDRVRWDLASDEGKGTAAGYRVYDGNKHKFFTVLRTPTVYSTDLSALLGDAGGSHPYSFSPFALEPKGAVQEVPCDRMVAEDAQLRYDVCLANHFPMLPLRALGGAMEIAVPFSDQLEKNGQFPLDVMVRAREPGAPPGTIPKGPAAFRARLSVQKITRAHVSDAAFDLPGYEVVNSPTLAPPPRPPLK
jgi:hypothetical protein